MEYRSSGGQLLRIKLRLRSTTRGAFNRLDVERIATWDPLMGNIEERPGELVLVDRLLHELMDCTKGTGRQVLPIH